MVVEPGDRELCQIGIDVGMIGGELGAIIARPCRPQERRRARVVQVRVMKHRQPGITEEIWPDVVVMGGVADLVND